MSCDVSPAVSCHVGPGVVREASAPIRRHERRARFVDYRRSRSADLRDRLVRRHLPLARRIAMRFVRRGIPLDDLHQVASIGLIHAVDRFDPGRGVPFDAFAVPTIVGEIKHHFRDRSWDVHVSRRLQELHLRVNATVDHLAGELGRSPTVPEISAAVDASVEEVVEAIEAGAAYSAASLYSPTTAADTAVAVSMEWRSPRPPRRGPSVDDLLTVDDPWLISAVDRVLVGDLLANLPERERRVVEMRYWEHCSQEAIARRLGISQMHVSRLLRRSLEKLRDTITLEDDESGGAH